jgi:hypothetical protein
MATYTLTSGEDTFSGDGADDVVIVPSQDTIDVGLDAVDGGGGNDTIQIGGTADFVDFVPGDPDAPPVFQNFETIAFTDSLSSVQAQFAYDQFVAGVLSSTPAFVGADGVQNIQVSGVDAVATFDASGWRFTSWDAGVDTITFLTDSLEAIVGTGQNDIFRFSAGEQTVTGGSGADIFEADDGPTTLSFGGSGTAGTVSGYDTVTDFTPGIDVASSETLSVGIATVIGVFDETYSDPDTEALQAHTGFSLNSVQTSDGIARFGDSGGNTDVALTTEGDVAAAALLLSRVAHEAGVNGTAVAFVATLAGVTHTYVYVMRDFGGVDSDLLFDLANVSATGLAANGIALAVLDTTAPDTPTITAIPERTAGYINAAAASDGTEVVVSVSGAIAGDVVKVHWDIYATEHTLSAADIVAGSATVTVSADTIAARGDTGFLGSFSVTADVTDRAGNRSAPSDFMDWFVRVDTDPPATPPALLLDLDSDSGAKSDGLTNQTTVRLNSTGSTFDRFAVYDGATLLGTGSASGHFEFETTLAEGIHSLTAVLTDQAGNVGTASTPFALEIDTMVATATIDSLGDDTGVAGDFETSVAPQTVRGSYTGTFEAGDTIEVKVNDGHWVAATVDTVNATWAADVSLVGTFGTLHVRTTDAAGNQTSGFRNYRLDHTAPPGTPLITGLATDTGDPGDFITSSANGIVTGTLDIPLFTGEVIQIRVDGGAWQDVDMISASRWSSEPVTLSPGNGTIEVRSVDLAGNVHDGVTRSYVLDQTAPTAEPSGLDIAAGFDTGSSSTDNVTRSSSLVITGNVNDDDTNVLLFDDRNNDGVYDGGDTSLGVVDVSGFSFQASVTLAEGVHRVRAQSVDAAGNQGPVSDALAITVDKTIQDGRLSLDPLIDATEAAHASFRVKLPPDLYSSVVVTFLGSFGAIQDVTIGGSGMYSVDLSGFPSGPVSTLMTVRDLAGNVTQFNGGAAVLVQDSNLVLSLSEYRAWGAAQLAGIDSITLTVDAVSLSKTPAAKLSEWASAGIDSIEVFGNVYLTVDQYNALGAMALTGFPWLIVKDTGARLATLDMSGLAARDVRQVDATDNVLTLTLAQAQALGPGILTPADNVTVADDGALLSALSTSQLQGLRLRKVDVLRSTTANPIVLDRIQADWLGTMKVDGGGATLIGFGFEFSDFLSPARFGELVAKGFDVVDTTDDFLLLDFDKYLQRHGARFADDDQVTLSVDNRDLKVLGLSGLAALAGNGIDALSSAAPRVTLSIAQYQALGTVEVPSGATLQDSSAAIGALDFSQLSDNFFEVDLTDGQMTVTATQLAELWRPFARADRVTLADGNTGILAFLSSLIELAEEFEVEIDLSMFGIDVVDSTDDALSLTVEESLTLGPVEFADEDTVTLRDTGASIAALSSQQIARLALKGVDIIDATDDVLPLTIGQASALGSITVADSLMLQGSAGNDRFKLSYDAFARFDVIDGGVGFDTIILAGDFAGGATLADEKLTDVEQLAFQAGASYGLTTSDGNVAAGERLIVNGTNLGSDALRFDGTAETDGSFQFHAGGGASSFAGGSGADRIIYTGGGSLEIRYTAAGQSTGPAYDTIDHFDGETCTFDLWTSVTDLDAPITTGALSAATFDADLAAAMAGLAIGHAVLFTADAGALAGAQFLVVNADVNGYQAGADLVVRLNASSNMASFGAGSFV